MVAKIYAATTKKCEFPTDPTYVPLLVGRSQIDDWQGERDSSGFSISEKNPFYCELTGQYWIWKNDRASDIKGLCHYRRYLWLNKPSPFVVKRSCGDITDCDEYLRADGLNAYFASCDCLLPRAYAFSADTVRSQFVENHGTENLHIMTEAVRTVSPEYLPTMETVFERRYVFFANIIIARRAVFDDYSAWLFAVLFEAEKHVDLTDPKNARLFGYYSERLLNVYMEHNRINCKELPELFISGERGAKFIDNQRVDVRYFKRRYCPNVLKWEEKIRCMTKKTRSSAKK